MAEIYKLIKYSTDFENNNFRYGSKGFLEG